MARIKETPRKYTCTPPKKPKKKQKKSQVPTTKVPIPKDAMPMVPTPSTIKKVVQYFQKFHDEDINLDTLSSRVWTKTDFHRSFSQQPQYDTVFSLFQLVYHSYYYVFQKNMGRNFGDWKVMEQNPRLRYDIGTIENPNIANLKQLANRVYSKVWEITDLENKIQYSGDRLLRSYQEKLGVVHNLELKLEKIVIIECGGCLQLDDDRKRFIIQLPTEFTGGEFVVQTDTNTEKLEEENISWITAKFAEKQLPVTGGCQILIVGFPQLSLQVDEIYRNFETKGYGPPAPAPEEIQSIAKELDGTRLGLLLSDQYDDKPEYNLQMLSGRDKYIVEALQELGCSFDIQSVLYCQTNSNRSSVPKSEVYLWSSDLTNYMLGRTSEVPQSEIPPLELPFFDLELCNQHVYKRELWDYDDFDLESASEEEGVPDDLCRPKGDIRYFLVPALIIQFPTWWTRARLLWIAKNKNSPSDCAISVLPNDVIKIICANLREENKKKRKRDHSEDSEEGSENSEDSQESAESEDSQESEDSN